LANRALEGETNTLFYKGKRLRLVPESGRIDPATRFDKLTPLQIINPQFPNLEDVDMLPEMQREWEQDWKDEGFL